MNQKPILTSKTTTFSNREDGHDGRPDGGCGKYNYGKLFFDFGIEAKEQNDAIVLRKYNDPIEDARENITVEEARQIAREDPSLIYAEIDAAALIREQPRPEIPNENYTQRSKSHRRFPRT
jgi:hypothetical protein